MNLKKQWIIETLLLLSLLALFALQVFSHCEIPCGIYDDEARIKMIEENIATVEKSMKQIVELSNPQEKQNGHSLNQIVRWVQNKEKHADDIIHIVTQYFMTQRVKPVSRDSENYAGYVKKLTLLHEMMFYTMKSKQTTELGNVEKLNSLLHDFRQAYFYE